MHISPYYPPDIGGGENCVYQIAEEQASLGHRVTVLTTSRDQASRRSTFVFTRSQCEHGKVEIQRIGSFIFRQVPVSLSLPPKFCGTECDIVHIHLNSMPYQPEIVAMLEKLRGIPIISHVHIDPEVTLSWLKPYLYMTSRFVFGLSELIVVPTHTYARKITARYGHQSKIRVVQNGIDLTKFSAAKREKSGDFNILFVGRIIPQKGLDRLIPVMHGITKVMSSVKLEVVGPSLPSELTHYHSITEMIDKFDLNNVVQFRGRIPEKDLLKAYHRASVLVAPSRFESFGLVILEAMATGVPVIASDLPEFQEIAGDNAILVEPTTERLTNAIITIANDARLRRKMIDEGQKRASDFAWKTISTRILDLYREIMEKQ